MTSEKHFRNISLSFWTGVLYFFGLRKSRISEIKKVIESRSDEEAIGSDWLRIGNDIHRVYKREAIKLHPHACK
jgi:hypothetical protein